MLVGSSPWKKVNKRLEEWRYELEGKVLKTIKSKTEYTEYDFGEKNMEQIGKGKEWRQVVMKKVRLRDSSI